MKILVSIAAQSNEQMKKLSALRAEHHHEMEGMDDVIAKVQKLVKMRKTMNEEYKAELKKQSAIKGKSNDQMKKLSALRAEHQHEMSNANDDIQAAHDRVAALVKKRKKANDEYKASVKKLSETSRKH